MAAEVESALGYFLNNRERMMYGTFRAKGYFIGSGVIEAGCRTVIGQRCKQSGMFWSEAGAASILGLRSINASACLQDYWNTDATNTPPKTIFSRSPLETVRILSCALPGSGCPPKNPACHQGVPAPKMILFRKTGRSSAW